MISSMFGGRIAEEIVFGKEHVTTGATNDIERATQLARNMVTRWGLSEKLGPLTYSEEQDEVFLGHSVTKHKVISDETTHLIDEEIRALINRNYRRAETLLRDNIDKLHMMAESLMKYETIDGTQIKAIMEGKLPPPPEGWDEEGGQRQPPAEGKVNTPAPPTGKMPKGQPPAGKPA